MRPSDLIARVLVELVDRAPERPTAREIATAIGSDAYDVGRALGTLSGTYPRLSIRDRLAVRIGSRRGARWAATEAGVELAERLGSGGAWDGGHEGENYAAAGTLAEATANPSPSPRSVVDDAPGAEPRDRRLRIVRGPWPTRMLPSERRDGCAHYSACLRDFVRQYPDAEGARCPDGCGYFELGKRPRATDYLFGPEGEP